MSPSHPSTHIDHARFSHVQATALARAMVTKYGFSARLGTVSLEYEEDSGGRGGLSSETRAVVEEEVKALLQVGLRGGGTDGGGI